ncbi:hypothetical protein NRIC_00170 [Enterococcus florum]|uniref:N-acetyltransferase domain-containing protein n=1 Tax=Enterococcus florum TaxID=2480627 RepID=A0A4P5P3U0_9ENTE|nr:GNAT family N-acetyltransferase [Enterococcus florum]GCF92126.1 hypothetical protein NRIC_00170 [Enterococcus florum]
MENPVITNGMQLAIIDKQNGSLIGDVYLKKEDTHIWIGYTISPSNSRKGYAYEVIQEVIEWGRSQKDISAVKAGVDPANTASIKLLQKLGFSIVMEEEDEDVYLFAF